MLKRWIVTASGDRPLAEVRAALARAGFEVGDVLDAVGILTGTADDAVVAALRAVPGVAAVEPDQVVDIGPPNEPATW